MRVMLGGWTRSWAASSPTVRSPLRNRHPSTAIAPMLSELSGCRSLRQPPAQAHHGEAQLARKPGVGPGSLWTVGMSLA